MGHSPWGHKESYTDLATNTCTWACSDQDLATQCRGFKSGHQANISLASWPKIQNIKKKQYYSKFNKD